MKAAVVTSGSDAITNVIVADASKDTLSSNTTLVDIPSTTKHHYPGYWAAHSGFSATQPSTPPPPIVDPSSAVSQPSTSTSSGAGSSSNAGSSAVFGGSSVVVSSGLP